MAQEFIHTMSWLKGGKKFMSIKADLEKGYYRLRWSFVDDTLQATSIPNKLRHMIMEGITTLLMRVLWNGELTDSFPMERDRLSFPLYLFVLCIK